MNESDFKILVLDGGGSKGIYTLGVLNELEKKLGGLLHEHFNLIYGTSTGSIITALIALGYSVQQIKELYLEFIPEIMSGSSKSEKSKRLEKLADKVFEDKEFDSVKTDIGIVSLNYDKQEPLIFKSNIEQAHGMKHSFVPGFGCSISTAVQCSCSAYPIFDIKRITTSNQGEINVIDGGFVANNASLYALIDAYKAYKINEDNIRLLSVGTGKYVERSLGWKYRVLYKIQIIQFVERVLTANTATNVRVAELLFPNLSKVRINETFNEPEYGTNMVEMDASKLNKMFQLGRDSFAKSEKDINKLFNIQ